MERLGDFNLTISELLKVGRDQPTTGAELAAILKINKRTVYARISRERAAGALIIGCNEGFYLAEDRHDLEAFATRSQARGIKTIAAGTIARHELKKTEGQTVLYPTTDETRQAPEETTDNP